MIVKLNLRSLKSRTLMSIFERIVAHKSPLVANSLCQLPDLLPPTQQKTNPHTHTQKEGNGWGGGVAEMIIDQEMCRT